MTAHPDSRPAGPVARSPPRSKHSKQPTFRASKDSSDGDRDINRNNSSAGWKLLTADSEQFVTSDAEHVDCGRKAFPFPKLPVQHIRYGLPVAQIVPPGDNFG